MKTQNIKVIVKALSRSAQKAKSNSYIDEWKTATGGSLSCQFLSTGRVKTTFRDRLGLKEGWIMRDFTLNETLSKLDDWMKM